MFKKRIIIALATFGLLFGALASKGYAFGGLMVEKFSVNAQVWGAFWSGEKFNETKELNITVTFWKNGMEVGKKTFSKANEMMAFEKALDFDTLTASGEFKVAKKDGTAAPVMFREYTFKLNPEGDLVQKVQFFPYEVKAAPPVAPATPAATPAAAPATPAGMRAITGEVIFTFKGKGSSIYLNEIDFVTRANEFEDSDFGSGGLF